MKIPIKLLENIPQKNSARLKTKTTSFRFRYFILASIIVHIAVIGLLHLGSLLNSLKSNDSVKSEVVEISFIDNQTNTKSNVKTEKKLKQIKPIQPKTIVESDSAAANNNLVEDAKFLSEKNNSVTKETRAKTGLKFLNVKKVSQQNKPSKPEIMPQSQQSAQQSKIPSKQALNKIEKSDIFAKPFDAYAAANKNQMLAQQKNEQQNSESSEEGSTTNDNLEQVEDDLMTRLNTKEYKYFGYYSRIKKQLNQWWVPKVQQKFTKILKQGRTIASEENKITKLVIILNDVGRLVKVQVLAESGIRELDDAAIEAFRSAAPFPNPPKGMIEQDGTVRIRWDCVVEG